MAISNINNNEGGGSVRAKLNAVIAILNDGTGLDGDGLAVALYAALEVSSPPETQDSPGTKGQWHDDGAGNYYRHNGTQWTLHIYGDTFDNT
ncbi:MAG: hypothetical protein AAGJ81_01370 [Verrucomicrobiota bacterium]